MVTEIFSDSMDSAKALAESLCQQSPDAVAGVKRLYNKVWWRNDRYTLARETLYQLKVILSKNQKIKRSKAIIKHMKKTKLKRLKIDVLGRAHSTVQYPVLLRFKN